MKIKAIYRITPEKGTMYRAWRMSDMPVKVLHRTADSGNVIHELRNYLRWGP